MTTGTENPMDSHFHKHDMSPTSDEYVCSCGDRISGETIATVMFMTKHRRVRCNHCVGEVRPVSGVLRCDSCGRTYNLVPA